METFLLKLGPHHGNFRQKFSPVQRQDSNPPFQIRLALSFHQHANGPWLLSVAFLAVPSPSLVPALPLVICMVCARLVALLFSSCPPIAPLDAANKDGQDNATLPLVHEIKLPVW